jgi:hypothetical protein
LVQAGIPPTPDIFISVLSAQAQAPGIRAAKSGQEVLDVFDQYLELMNSFNVRPDVEAHNCILLALGRAGQLPDMEAYLGRMASLGAEPDVMSYKTACNAYFTLGRPSRAFIFFLYAKKKIRVSNEDSGALIHFGLRQIAEAADKVSAGGGTGHYHTQLETVHATVGMAYFLMESLENLPMPRAVSMDVLSTLIASHRCLVTALKKHPLHSSSQIASAAGDASPLLAEDRHVTHVMSQAHGLLARLALPPLPTLPTENATTPSARPGAGPGQMHSTEELTQQQLEMLPITVPMMGALRRLVVRVDALIQPACQQARLHTFIPPKVQTKVTFVAKPALRQPGGLVGESPRAQASG